MRMRTTLPQSHMENEMEYEVHLNLLYKKESNLLNAAQTRETTEYLKQKDYEKC